MKVRVKIRHNDGTIKWHTYNERGNGVKKWQNLGKLKNYKKYMHQEILSVKKVNVRNKGTFGIMIPRFRI